jgi:hypothetical protein
MYNTNFGEKPQFTFAKRTIRKLIFSFGFFIFVAACVSILFTGCSKDIEFISKGLEKRNWRKAYEPVFDTNYVASFVEGDPVIYAPTISQLQRMVRNYTNMDYKNPFVKKTLELFNDKKYTDPDYYMIMYGQNEGHWVIACPYILDEVVQYIVYYHQFEDGFVFNLVSLDMVRNSIQNQSSLTSEEKSMLKIYASPFNIIQYNYNQTFDDVVNNWLVLQANIRQSQISETRCGQMIIQYYWSYVYSPSNPDVPGHWSVEVTFSIDYSACGGGLLNSYGGGTNPEESTPPNTGVGSGNSNDDRTIKDEIPELDNDCAELLTDRIHSEIMDLINNTTLPCSQLDVRDVIAQVFDDNCPESEDPWGGNPPDFGMGGEAFDTGVDRMGFSSGVMEGVNAALEGEEKLYVHRSNLHLCKGKELKDICPKLDNIFNMLIGEGTHFTTANCELLKDIAESELTQTNFVLDCEGKKITETRTDGTLALAQFQRGYNGFGTIYFHGDVCEMSCLELASVVIHEALHAKFTSMVFHRIPDFALGQYVTLEEFKRYWDDLVKRNYNNITNQHDIIAQFYIDEFAKAVHAAFGEQGNWEDYRFWAYKHLGPQYATAGGSTVITQEQSDAYEAIWNSVKDDIQIDCD